MAASLVQRLTLAILLATTLALASSGCTLMSRGPVNSRPLEPGELDNYRSGAEDEPVVSTEDQPTVTVAIKTQFGRKKAMSLPLEHGMTLQDVLVATNVTRRFRDMEINVMRVTPQSNGQRVPLQAEYDTTHNRVGVLHDMTLHPGDHIVIVETSKSALEEALGGLVGGSR